MTGSLAPQEELAEALSWTSGEMTRYDEDAHPDHNRWSWRGDGHGEAMRQQFREQADALAPVVARMVADAERRLADAIERRCAEVYPEDVFRVPTSEDCAEMHAIMRRERGHGLDGFGAHAMRFAHRAIAAEIRRDGLERWRTDADSRPATAPRSDATAPARVDGRSERQRAREGRSREDRPSPRDPLVSRQA